MFDTSTEEPSRKLLTLKGIVLMAGDQEGTNIQTALNQFGEHENWMLFHTHPPRGGRAYNGMSALDLSSIFYNNLTIQNPTPTVHHTLITDIDFSVTWLDPSIFDTHLRIFTAYKQEFSTYEELLMLYRKLFDRVESDFVTRFQSYQSDTVCMNILNKISFLPHDQTFVTVFTPLLEAELSTNPELKKVWEWFLIAGETIHVASEDFKGLFQTDSFDLKHLVDILHSGQGPLIEIDDGGYIFDHTTPWVNEELPQLNPAMIEPMLRGGKRRTRRRKYTRKLRLSSRYGRTRSR